MFIATMAIAVWDDVSEICEAIALYFGIALLLIGWVLTGFFGDVISPDDGWIVPFGVLVLGATLVGLSSLM